MPFNILDINKIVFPSIQIVGQTPFLNEYLMRSLRSYMGLSAEGLIRGGGLCVSYFCVSITVGLSEGGLCAGGGGLIRGVLRYRDVVKQI